MSTQQAPTTTPGNVPIDRTIFGGQGESSTEASTSKAAEELKPEGSEAVPAVTDCDAQSSIQHNPGSSFSGGLGNFAAEALASEAGVSTGISTATAPPTGAPVPRSHHTPGSAILGRPGQVSAESPASRRADRPESQVSGTLIAPVVPASQASGHVVSESTISGVAPEVPTSSILGRGRSVGPIATASPTGHSSPPVPQDLRSPTNPDSVYGYLKTPTLGQPAGIGSRNHSRSTSRIEQWEPNYQEWPFTMESYCPEMYGPHERSPAFLGDPLMIDGGSDDGLHIQKAIMSRRANTIFDDAVESEMLVTEVVEAGGKPDERILRGTALIKRIEVTITDIHHTAPTVVIPQPEQKLTVSWLRHSVNIFPDDISTTCEYLRTSPRPPKQPADDSPAT